jgi:hypothetical protein
MLQRALEKENSDVELEVTNTVQANLTAWDCRLKVTTFNRFWVVTV